MPALILISGAGQLGSRYLQGMAKCNSPLRIFVHDRNKWSIELAKKRWDEVSRKNNAHVVSYITSLKKLPQTIDIAIVSTTADVRLSAVNDICKNTNVNYWILEKVLVQSENDLDKLISTIKEARVLDGNSRYFLDFKHREIQKETEGDNPDEQTDMQSWFVVGLTTALCRKIKPWKLGCFKAAKDCKTQSSRRSQSEAPQRDSGPPRVILSLVKKKLNIFSTTYYRPLDLVDRRSK